MQVTFYAMYKQFCSNRYPLYFIVCCIYSLASAIRCYDCVYQFNGETNFTSGDPACGDATWNLDSSSSGFINETCQTCFKEYYDLGGKQRERERERETQRERMVRIARFPTQKSQKKQRESEDTIDTES